MKAEHEPQGTTSREDEVPTILPNERLGRGLSTPKSYEDTGRASDEEILRKEGHMDNDAKIHLDKCIKIEGKWYLRHRIQPILDNDYVISEDKIFLRKQDEWERRLQKFMAFREFDGTAVVSHHYWEDLHNFIASEIEKAYQRGLKDGRPKLVVTSDFADYKNYQCSRCGTYFTDFHSCGTTPPLT